MLFANRLTSYRCGAPARVLRQFYYGDLLNARYTSNSVPSSRPSALLSRLPKDIHAAMRSRDKTRLSALRSILADVTNSSKTSSPIKDDLALLSAIRKRIESTKQSIQQFYEAGRKDLVGSEEESLRVLEEYAAGVKTMTVQEVREQILQVLDNQRDRAGKLSISDVMKACVGPGGAFEGRMVEKSLVAKTVREIVQSDATP
jgi:uncharacterized protein